MTAARIVGVASLLATLAVAVKYGNQYLDDAHVGLLGPARESFIRAAVQNCKDRQGAFPTTAMMKAVCSCYSERLADTLSNNDVQAIGSHDPSLSIPMQPRIDAVAKYCVDRAKTTGNF
ncbi:MAG: hypothetical protein JO056_01415 [Alphaproteobacteria bacterium]|jgi:hypothetical protein|nr:hypothetical protein [Alphaproteobacteria bacterium]